MTVELLHTTTPLTTVSQDAPAPAGILPGIMDVAAPRSLHAALVEMVRPLPAAHRRADAAVASFGGAGMAAFDTLAWRGAALSAIAESFLDDLDERRRDDRRDEESARRARAEAEALDRWRAEKQQLERMLDRRRIDVSQRAAGAFAVHVRRLRAARPTSHPREGTGSESAN